MSQFRYIALSHDGQRVSGVTEGFNELDAAARIKETHSAILKLTEIKEEKTKSILNIELSAEKLNNKAFMVMCSQFAIILKSGVPITHTIYLIADNVTDRPLKKILQSVAKDVESGLTLSDAFEEHGDKLLPTTFIETLRAGEKSGTLDTSFERMYLYFKKQMNAKNQVKNAMFYPLFVLIVAIIVVIILMIKVVPQFISIFEEMDAELPKLTQILIAISLFFQHYIFVLALIVLLIAIIYQIISHTEEGRIFLSKINLKIPILGNIVHLNAASQFANSMATLLSAGLTINKAVSITAKTLDNYSISQETGKLSSKLEEGYTLSRAMRESKIFPNILIDMTAVGESTGDLAEAFNTIALYYDTELEMATQQIVSKLEPIMLIALSLIVGFIVIAVYSAMFTMYNSMS